MSRSFLAPYRGERVLRTRPARVLAACGVTLIAALVLAWLDVLPGGWRLRGLVVPHAVREQRERERHFDARLADFAAEGREQTADAVVFIGASTIERCPLASLFPGCRVANRGIASARARELAARLDDVLDDVLGHAQPTAIVLQARGPDRVTDPLAVDAVLAGVDALARARRC